MNNNSMVDIERLKEQLLSNSKFKQNDKQKEKICKRLHEQLVEKEAVVKIQRMDAECLNLIDSLQQRLLFLQDVLSPSKNHNKKSQRNEDKTTKDNIKIVKNEFKIDDLFELNLSSDSSDDETLSVKIAKNKTETAAKSSTKITDKEEVKEMESVIETENKKQEHEIEIDLHQDSDQICSSLESDVPLALRRQPRERKSSYTSFSSPSSSSKNLGKNHRSISHGKRETAVSTSGVAYHDDDDIIIEEDCNTPHTFHIKIPSLFKGQVHELRLDSLEFGRKVFDYRARQAKQKCLELKQQQQLDCLTNTKKKKSQKKNEQFATSRHQEILQQDAQFSQLIEDVMNDTGNEETLQATKALENINNDINDNYESIVSLLPLSQSSHELSLSQNSKECSNTNEESTKKRRKTSKRPNDQKPNEPAKKRGRKPKHKNLSELDISTQSQPPTKSNLAKYVEYFANDCELLPPGSQTPAASSTMSQPLVSSTTQNFELNEQQQQQTNQHIQQQQQPITYFIDGDWANGGPCQLVQTTGMSIDAGQINQDTMSAPFQDFVNYIDNNTDTGNNVIARVLDNCNSLPISIPLPIANMGYKNIFQPRQLQQPTIQNMLNQPIINIQIPSLPPIPNNVGAPPAPPTAHLHEGVLDLSIKSNAATINTYDVLNLNKKSKPVLELSSTEDNCLPLDLSIKNASLYQNCANTSNCEDTQLSVVEIQDDDFIRHLIETSDFDLRPQELTKDCNETTNYDDAKSFKAALNMPLLEFDVQVLDQFVENSAAKINDIDENDKLNDNVIVNDSTNCISNNDSNYVSMNESNSNILNSPFGNEIHFADQSTKEIFHKLLDIRPPKDDCNLEYMGDKETTFSFAELDESTFVHNNVQNSTMYEGPNVVTNQKNSKESQDNSSIIQQSILNSADEKTKFNKTNDNKPAAVQKFFPRILKRRNSLFKKTAPLPNYHEKSNDDNTQIVENLNENLNKSATQIETNISTNTPSNDDPNKSVMLTAETNITTNALKNDDCANDLSEHLIVQNESSMELVKINKKREDTKELNEDLYVSESSDITSNFNISLNESHKKLKKDNISKDKKEEFTAKLSSNTSTESTLNYSNNESPRETFEEIKNPTSISKDSSEQLTPIADHKDNNLERSFDVSENENSTNIINECPMDILKGVETIEMANTKQSTYFSDNKQSCTEAENQNMEQLTEDSSINWKISEIENLSKKPLQNSENSPKKSKDVNVSASDSLVESNYSNKSIEINCPEKSIKSDDVPLNLEMSESDPLETSNKSIPIKSTYKCIEADKSLNLEIPKTDQSKKDELKQTTLVEIYEPKENDLLEQTHRDNKDEIRSISNENVSSSKTVLNCNTVCFNEKVVFSIAKITLSDDEALLTDSDTISRKSLDNVPIHLDNELKMKDSNIEVQSYYIDYKRPQSVDLQVGSSDPKDFNNMSQTDTEAVIDAIESNNNSLCLTTEIQKKYYAESCISDVIDLSVKNDTDMEDNLVIDLDDTQSPKVVNVLLHKLIKEQCHSSKTENTENPTTINIVLQETRNNNAPKEEGSITTNDKIDDGNIDVSGSKNKQQTLNFCSLKAPDISHLTPLELDSKLEDSLDFEEDFDDALSLATSCFDSPNDDRFEESVLNESEQQTSIAQITNNDSPPPYIDNVVTEQKPIINTTLQTTQNVQTSSNGLKNFKIPKITKLSTTEKNMDIQIKCKGLTTVSSPKTNIPVIPNIILKQAVVKLENITRTVKNELAAKGSVNVIQLQQQQVVLTQTPAKQHIQLNFTDKTELLPSSENITRTVKNDLAAKGSVNVIQQQQVVLTQTPAQQHIKLNITDKTELLPSSEIGPQNIQALHLSDNLTKLFGITCLPYLVNKCYAITQCPLSHQLNDPDSVFQALSLLSTFDLSNAYRYIYNHSNMFKVYFIVFCNLFTLRKDRTKLLNMINDVERYPEYSQFVITIYEAIVKCGLSRANACRQILKRSRERTTFNIDALVAIIMKSDWTMFTDYIEQYTEEIYKYNFSIGVLEQMAPAVLNSKGSQLKQVFGKCVQTLRCEDTGLLLNSPSLIQCVALLTSTT